MVICQKTVYCPLQVGRESLPQVKEFKHLWIVLKSEGKMECEIDRPDWCSVSSTVSIAQNHFVKAGAEPEVDLHSNPHLGS